MVCGGDTDAAAGAADADRLRGGTILAGREHDAERGEREEAGAGATDYLHLFGWTALASLWAQMAKVALAAKAGGNGSLSAEERGFYDAKVATARFFFARLLPRSGAHFASLMAGSKPMMAFPDAAF